MTQKDLFKSMEDPSSSQGDSPVSPSRKPDSDKELRIKKVVISGQKCTELFPLLNLSGSLAKMCQGLLHFPWYSKERLLTWKHQAIRQSVSIFQLAPRTLSTNDNDFGLLPTPRASSAMAAKLSPNLAKRAKEFGNLEEVMSAIFFPTPTANEDAAGRPEGKMQRMLGNHPEVRNTGEGTLNPDWVEAYLMDYEIGWTRVSSDSQESQPKSKTEQHDSKPLEMQSFPPSQKSSQEQS